METKWLITHMPAPEHDAVTRVTTRIVNLIEYATRRDGARERMKAEIKITSHIDGAIVRVLFSPTASSNEWHARAEAARLYAQLADTRGDLENEKDEPLEIELRADALDRRVVEVSGPDALTCVAVFFGDDVAEALL